MRPFSDFLYGFRSSWSTADLQTVVTDRIARVVNRPEATTQAVVLDIFKAFDSIWHTGFLHKFKSDRISGRIFGRISSFLRKRQIRVVLFSDSNIQLMLEFLEAPFFVLHFSYYALMAFLMLPWYCYLCWWYYCLFHVWSGIWSVATPRIGFWNWIWSMRDSGLG